MRSILVVWVTCLLLLLAAGAAFFACRPEADSAAEPGSAAGLAELAVAALHIASADTVASAAASVAVAASENAQKHYYSFVNSQIWAIADFQVNRIAESLAAVAQKADSLVAMVVQTADSLVLTLSVHACLYFAATGSSG